MFDPSLRIAAHRRRIATNLRQLSPTKRRAHLRMLVVETGGTFVEPEPGNSAGSLFVEFTLLGLYHRGDCLDQAISGWIETALRARPSPSIGKDAA